METDYIKTPRGWEAVTTIAVGDWQILVASFPDGKYKGFYNLVTDVLAWRINKETGLPERNFRYDFCRSCARSAKNYTRIIRPSIEQWHEMHITPGQIAEYKRMMAQHYSRPDMQLREGGAEFAKALWADLGAEMGQAA